MELFEVFPDPMKRHAITLHSATPREVVGDHAHEAVVKALIRTSQVRSENIGLAFRAQSHLLRALGTRLKLCATPIGASVQIDF